MKNTREIRIRQNDGARSRLEGCLRPGKLGHLMAEARDDFFVRRGQLERSTEESWGMRISFVIFHAQKRITMTQRAAA